MNEDLSLLISSQPVTPPAELIHLLESGEPPSRLHAALTGLYLPEILRVRGAAEQLLERLGQPLAWLDERFVVALWEDWHPVSFGWSEEECWIATFDHEGKFEVLSLKNPGGLSPPSSLNELVLRVSVVDQREPDAAGQEFLNPKSHG